jgi:hypothetical protein
MKTKNKFMVVDMGNSKVHGCWETREIATNFAIEQVKKERGNFAVLEMLTYLRPQVVVDCILHEVDIDGN